jgi:hypothetical protein
LLAVAGSLLTGQYAHTHGITDNVDHSVDDSLKGENMALTNTLAGRNLGMLLLGLWLILTGLLPLLSIKLSSTVTTGLAVLGIVAGILILLRR